MGQGSKQKNIHPYSIAIITVAILVFVVIAYSIFSYFTNERHSHGGGFKSIETPINFEAGIIEPGEVGESDIELKKK